jgi:dethiobiotin synthetase
MMRGLFVTGTDTEVGKTVVSAALMHRYRGQFPLRYWKPVQTGVEEQDDTLTVRNLAQCTDAEILDQGVRLKHPLSPHLAAELEGETIEVASVCRLAVGEASDFYWIVEGAGGVLVPLNKQALMVDLIKTLELPVVVVSRTELGTINHTLLTIEALLKRELTVAGVVLVGEKRFGTRESIQEFGNIEILGEMPRFPDLNSATLREWSQENLDSRDHIATFLNWQRAKHAC